MRKYLYILLFGAAVVLSGMMGRLQAQVLHPMGISEMVAAGSDDLSGTARFVGLAGAMTAVGGDPSAVKQNPGGLGIYRHSQFSVSADVAFRRFYQDPTDRGKVYPLWHVAQASYVFSFVHPERVAGVVANNLMVSYAKRADLRCDVLLNDRNHRSDRASDWTELDIDESGSLNDMNLHYGMNVSNRFYWGVGMALEWVQMRQTLGWWQYIAEDRRGKSSTSAKEETSRGQAVGWSGSIGLLYRPIEALRFGISAESPVMGRMKETYFYDEHTADGDYSSPTYNDSWAMRSPVRASAGLGIQFGRFGLLSAQYDMQYHKLSGYNHTGRIGVEGVINSHFMVDAGYSYSTRYNLQHVSVAAHYMGRWIRFGLAYSAGWSTNTVSLATLEVPTTATAMFKTWENRFVATLQWNM